MSWDLSAAWYGFLSWLQAYRDTILAGLAFLVSLLALRHSRKSADAASRSATAAEVSNQHAAKSADAAEVSIKNAVKAFENEEKRKRAQAYWMLYRIHNLIEASSWKPELFDVSPIQEFLHVYGHTLDRETRENVRIALNGIEKLVASFSPGGSSEQEKIRQYVMKAAIALREDWM